MRAGLCSYHSALGRSRVPISSSVRLWRSEESTSCTTRPERARVVDVVGDDPWHVDRARNRDERLEQRALLLEPVIPALDGEPPIEDVVQPRGGLARAGCIAGDEPARDESARAAGEREQPLRVRGDGVERERGAPAIAVHARARDERGEIAVARAIFGEEHEMVRHAAVAAHGDLGADDALERTAVARLREGDDAAQLIVIGERERVVAELHRAIDELVGMRRAIEERERGVAVQLDVRTARVQSYHPCTNHRSRSRKARSSPLSDSQRQ